MSTKVEAVTVGSKGKVRLPWVILSVLVVLVILALAGFTVLGNVASGNRLTHTMSEPLGDVTSAKVDINSGDGNLIIDGQADKQVLVSGALEYLEKNGLPVWSVSTFSDKATITMNMYGEQKWSGLPWAACNGATDWQIHLNPDVLNELTTFSNGGNVRLGLAGMSIAHIMTETGGGNVEVILPDHAANLTVSAKTGGGDVTVEIGYGTTGNGTVYASSGAGNVAIRVPEGIAARIHATSGIGKVLVDSRFSQIDDATYQSPNYDQAADKVEITIDSGAGNVSVNTK